MIVDEDINLQKPARDGAEDEEIILADALEDEAPKEAKRVSIRKLYSMARGSDWLFFALGVTGAILNGFVQPGIVIFFGEFITEFIDVEGVIKLVVIMAIVGAFNIVVAAVQLAGMRMFAHRVIRRCRVAYFEAALYQDIAWFDTHEPAALPAQMADDMEKMMEAYADKVGNSIMGIASFIASFIIAFVLTPHIAAASLVMLPFIVIASFIMLKTMELLANETQSWYSAAAALVEECLFALRTVIAFGGEFKEIAAYTEAVEHSRKGGIRSGWRVATANAFAEAVMPLGSALALYIGMILVYKSIQNPVRGRPYSGGDVLTGFFLILTAGFQLGFAKGGVEALSAGCKAGGRFFSVLESIGTIQCKGEDSRDQAGSFESLELRDVHFSYPARPDVPVLRGVSFRITRGQKVAFVGESGSGKSTIMSLLERFYDPTKGAVCVNGRDYREFSVRSLRRHIGYVGQEPVLFATSIRSNIMFGYPGATDEDFERVRRSARLEFVDALPEQMETYVGAGGNQFSGGQKQRIAIARALLKDPDLLFLDEATSALDVRSEKQIQATIDGLSALNKNVTIVSIAHRLVTVKDAEHIFVLREGQVIEQGTHSDLIRQSGVYTGLAAAQRMSADDDDQEVVDLDRQTSREVELEELQPKTKLELNQEQKEKEKAEKELAKKYKVPYRRLFGYFKPEQCWLIPGLLGSVLRGLNYPMQAFVLIEAIVWFNFPPEIMRDKVEGIIPWFILIAAGVFVGVILQGGSFGIIGESIVMRLRIAILTAVFRQEVGFHDDPEHSPGQIGQALETWAFRVQKLIKALDANTSLIVALIGGLAVAFYGSWQMALVMLGFIPILVIAMSLQWVISFNGAKQTASKSQEAQVLISDSVQNARTVHATSIEETLIEHYSALIVEATGGYAVRGFMEGFAYGVSAGAPTLVAALAFYLMYLFLSNGISDYRGLLLAFTTVLYAAMGAGQAASSMGDMGKAKVACHDVFELLDRESKIEGLTPDGVVIQDDVGQVEFFNVHFSYPFRTEAKVLKGVNFIIPKGSRVGVCGPSGGGKSTIFSLIQRFYDPTEGDVLIGHSRTPLREINVRWYRGIIGYVGQEPVLFNTTVKKNVCYGMEESEVSEQRLEEVKLLAHLNFIDAASQQGWDTAVGPRGGRLSGGQKQRVAIARAALRDPPLLLLDEATSALDSASEKVVQTALDAASKGRTSIAIAHRLSTIASCDLILVCGSGIILEQGNHEELMALGGAYCKLQASV